MMVNDLIDSHLFGVESQSPKEKWNVYSSSHLPDLTKPKRNPEKKNP